MIDFKQARDAFAAGDVDLVCTHLAALYPDDPEIAQLREYVQFAMLGGHRPQSAFTSTGYFLESIARAQAGSTDVHLPRHYLSSEFDFIADMDGVEGWSLPQALNRLALDNLKARKKSAVVGTMRDDGIYVLEWVAHYLALGFDHIFIYTNDNADASDELFTLLAKHGVITLIESEVTGAVPPEAKAFGHALHLLRELRDYEWALFVDSDELLTLTPKYKNAISNVLDAVDLDHPGTHVAGICYDWLWFISDMVFERKPGLLCERFQHARPHWLSKCLVRIRDVQSMRRQHHPEVAPGYLVVDSELAELDIGTIWQRRTAQYGGGRLNHYWPRSFQEFAIKKARGASLGGENNLYDRPYTQFFSWNGYSEADNAFPTDERFLRSIKSKLTDLRSLEGISKAAKVIDDGFHTFLNRIVSPTQLRQDYERNATEPGDL